jgi:hypothetical protein
MCPDLADFVAEVGDSEGQGEARGGCEAAGCRALWEERRRRRTGTDARDAYATHAAGVGGARAANLARRRRFCAMAASVNSSCAPRGPRRRSRPSLRMRLRWANSISTRLRSRQDCSKRSSHVAGVLVDVAQDPASGHVRAALWFEWASPTHWHGCDVAHRMVGADRTCCRQSLACRANVEVARLVEGEVFA